MPTYRKKPVVVEAWRLPAMTHTQYAANFPEAPEWVDTAWASGELNYEFHDPAPGEWVVITLEDGVNSKAKHVGTIGDWLIQGVKGELYFCKPDIFDATYEPADPQPKPQREDEI